MVLREIAIRPVGRLVGLELMREDQLQQPRRKELITGATEPRDDHLLPVHLKAENVKSYLDFLDVTLFLESHITRTQKPVYFIKKETIKTKYKTSKSKKNTKHKNPTRKH